jgi:hypothetical protein
VSEDVVVQKLASIERCLGDFSALGRELLTP